MSGQNARKEDKCHSQGYTFYLYLPKGEACCAYQRKHKRRLNKSLFSEYFDEPIHFLIY